MEAENTTAPVHESLDVVEATDLYQTDEWRKAVVTYQFEDGDDETAVYLWHHDDDGWTRKNKYVVKTPEAWAADRAVIDSYIRSDPPTTETTAFPVSDYYTVGAGETVFQRDGWWKAIVNVVEKGDYETNEVMVYVWQERDGDWRRRQKYTIKRVSDWEAERDAVEDHLSMYASGELPPRTVSGHRTVSEDTSTVDTPTTDDIDKPSDPGDVGEFSTLDDELEAHLSGEFTGTGDS